MGAGHSNDLLKRKRARTPKPRLHSSRGRSRSRSRSRKKKNKTKVRSNSVPRKKHTNTQNLHKLDPSGQKTVQDNDTIIKNFEKVANEYFIKEKRLQPSETKEVEEKKANDIDSIKEKSMYAPHLRRQVSETSSEDVTRSHTDLYQKYLKDINFIRNSPKNRKRTNSSSRKRSNSRSRKRSNSRSNTPRARRCDSERRDRSIEARSIETLQERIREVKMLQTAVKAFQKAGGNTFSPPASLKAKMKKKKKNERQKPPFRFKKNTLLKVKNMDLTPEQVLSGDWSHLQNPDILNSCEHWHITDEVVDSTVNRQRKRLSLIASKVGVVDYNETKAAQEENKNKTVKAPPKATKFLSRHDAMKNFSYSCLEIKKKGFVPYDSNKQNQDWCMCHENLEHNMRGVHVLGLFGVCDGHGVFGHNVSELVANTLPKQVQDHFKLFDDVSELTDNVMKQVIESAVKNTADILARSDITTEDSGTTLVFSIIVNNRVFTANLGDSQGFRLELFRSQSKRSRRKAPRAKIHDLNRVHNPDIPGERERIENAGGVVSRIPEATVGPYRVWNKEMTGPGLAMSRSLGDDYSHTLGVSNIPEIKVQEITRNTKYLVWGSDGIFEFLKPKDVSEIMLRHKNLKDMAQAVLKEGIRMWRMFDECVDDMSLVFVEVNFNLRLNGKV